MAEVRSGSFYTTGYTDSAGYVDQYIFSWSLSSQSIENNTSTITWSLKGADGYGYTSVKEKYVTVNGETKSDSNWQNTYTGTVAFSGTSTIKHGADGTGKFSASAGGAFYYSGSYNSTGSGTWTLPTIPRATTPTFSATTVTMGSSITITMTPASSGFKHKLRYSFGSLTGQTSGLSIGENFSAAGTTTATFTPPTSLANQIPSATSGTCTIYCYTYNSSGTQIGSTVSKSITLNVPSYNLTGSVTLTGNNLLSSTYVQGKSTVTVNITAGSSYGASIKSYSSTLDGTTYSGATFTSNTLSSGSKTVSVTVMDTRNKSYTFTSSAITVYEYSAPYITAFNVARQSDGTTVIATLVGGVSSVNSKNTKTFKITLNGVTNTLTSTAYTINGSTSFANVPTDSTLTATATITDSYTSVTKTAVLPTVAVTMDFYKDGKGIAMGKVAEKSELLDVAWEIKSGKPAETLHGLSFRGRNIIDSDSDDTVSNWNTQGNLATMFFSAASQLTTKPSTYGFLINATTQKGSTEAHQIWLGQADGSIYHRGGNESGFYRWRKVFDDTNSVDYVVEQGTSNIWTYRKWNSGVAECWGTYSANIAISKTWGSMYYSDSLTPRINYPFTFTSRPIENVTFRGGSVAGWLYCEAGGYGVNSTTQTAQYGACRPTSIAAAELKFDFHVVGRWK